MTITMGQLVSTMFDAYERRYHDGELAAVATQVTLADLLRDAWRGTRSPPGEVTRSSRQVDQVPDHATAESL